MECISSKEDCVNEEGFWVCMKCPNEKYNFLFQLWNHWSTVHGTDHPFVIESRLTWSDFVQTGREIFERDLVLQQNGWSCGQCYPKGG